MAACTWPATGGFPRFRQQVCEPLEFRETDMERYLVVLSDTEFAELNRIFPFGEGSGLIGRRAAAIVRIHFQRRDPRCSFLPCPPGVDLQVALTDAEPLPVEIKGTAARDLSWQQLKVSSKTSHKLLCEGMPVYRVCSVFEQELEIYVLHHGIDFTLEPEARWMFKPIRLTVPASKRSESLLRAYSGHTARTSKYDSLRDHLASQDTNEVTIKFDDAASILGFSLPRSAYEYQAFWANQADTQNRPWARAWTEAGFEVDGYHLSEEGWVRFKRRRAEVNKGSRSP